MPDGWTLDMPGSPKLHELLDVPASTPFHEMADMVRKLDEITQVAKQMFRPRKKVDSPKWAGIGSIVMLDLNRLSSRDRDLVTRILVPEPERVVKPT